MLRTGGGGEGEVLRGVRTPDGFHPSPLSREHGTDKPVKAITHDTYKLVMARTSQSRPELSAYPGG